MAHPGKQISGAIEGRAVDRQHLGGGFRDSNRGIDAEGLRGCLGVKNDKIIAVDDAGIFVGIGPAACIYGNELARCQPMIGGRRENVIQ